MENYKEVSLQDLKKWIDEKKDFVLIDVLVQNSYDAQHIPGAVHAGVHEDDFLEKVLKFVPDKNKQVVVYCSSSTCQASPLAAGKLVEAGYMNVLHFKGGLADWQDAGYAFEGGVTEIKIEGKCNCCS